MAARVPDPERCERLRRGAARAVALPGVHSVVLFGSVACGRADEWSDVDVALIAEEPSEETAEAARRAFRDEIRDADAQIVWMTPGNGYAGAGETGGLGREAVRLGALLEDDGAYTEVYGMTRYTKTADERHVAERQSTVLTLVEGAVRTWRAHRSAADGRKLRALGKTTSDAGEILMKNGLGYRGTFAARTHDVLELVEKMRPEEGEVVPTLFEEESEGEFARWAELRRDTLDAKTSLDRLAVYAKTPVPNEEDQRRRIPVILETALEEHEALSRHPAMPGLARACAADVEDVRRATYGLRDDPDPAIAAAARKWAGVLEQAAERGCPLTRGEGAPDGAAPDPARHDARERGLRLAERDEDENDLELARRWYEDGEPREERCRVSFPPGTGEAKLEAMKRAWTSGRVTPDHLATPAECEATRRALVEPPPGKDTDLPAAPVEGTATRAAAEAMSPPRVPACTPGRGGGRDGGPGAAR